MITLLTILHVVFCVFLILVILLQTGKGGGMGAAFGGGGSSTVFGPRGAGSFIGKTTGVIAILFMLTSLSLAWLSSSSSTRLEDKAALQTKDVSGDEVDLGALSKKESLSTESDARTSSSPAEADNTGGDLDESVAPAKNGPDASAN